MTDDQFIRATRSLSTTEWRAINEAIGYDPRMAALTDEQFEQAKYALGQTLKCFGEELPSCPA
jgi:hypothetical protein